MEGENRKEGNGTRQTVKVRRERERKEGGTGRRERERREEKRGEGDREKNGGKERRE